MHSTQVQIQAHGSLPWSCSPTPLHVAVWFRGEMAAALSRALKLPGKMPFGYFTEETDVTKSGRLYKSEVDSVCVCINMC